MTENDMRQINIHEAKANLSKLIEKAVNGEAFVVAKSGENIDHYRSLT